MNEQDDFLCIVTVHVFSHVLFHLHVLVNPLRSDAHLKSGLNRTGCNMFDCDMSSCSQQTRPHMEQQVSDELLVMY